MEDREIKATRLIQTAADKGGERLDVFCARAGEGTRSAMQRLIDGGHIKVNGKTAKSKQKLSVGDRVEIQVPPVINTELIAQDIPLSIIYQDSDFAVIDKPKGLVVHPAPGNPSGTLVNAIMHHIKDLSGIGGEFRPGIVHRIDKLTSGLIAIAKNDAAHRQLSEQIKFHRAGRTYLALVEGGIKEDSGSVVQPIGRSHTDRKRMAVVQNGRSAVTHYQVLERLSGYTLIIARLETGRTHQIRVHMSYIKRPVVGDTVYGPPKPRLGQDNGQVLHAVRLDLAHPRTGEQMCFFAPIPDYFMAALRRAGYKGTAETILSAVKEAVEVEEGKT